MRLKGPARPRGFHAEKTRKMLQRHCGVLSEAIDLFCHERSCHNITRTIIGCDRLQADAAVQMEGVAVLAPDPRSLQTPPRAAISGSVRKWRLGSCCLSCGSEEIQQSDSIFNIWCPGVSVAEKGTVLPDMPDTILLSHQQWQPHLTTF
eukprot:s619_g17.t1